MKRYIPIGRRFSIIDRAFKHRLGVGAEKLGLTPVQLRVLGELSYLERQEEKLEVYQKDLENAEQVTHPTMTSMIQRLERKGFLVCAPSSLDHRYKKIRCTQKSKHMYEVMKEREDEILREIFYGLSDEEKNQLYKITEKILNNLGYPCNKK